MEQTTASIMQSNLGGTGIQLPYNAGRLIVRLHVGEAYITAMF